MRSSPLVDAFEPTCSTSRCCVSLPYLRRREVMCRHGTRPRSTDDGSSSTFCLPGKYTVPPSSSLLPPSSQDFPLPCHASLCPQACPGEEAGGTPLESSRWSDEGLIRRVVALFRGLKLLLRGGHSSSIIYTLVARTL